jgi:PKD repeat protein
MKLAARFLSVLTAGVVLWLHTGAAGAQSGCGPTGTQSSVSMPQFAGTLTAGNLSTAGGSSNYLYVLTQWGFARASLANPASPGTFSQVVIADEPGSGNGGLIQLSCDCHQGGTAFAAAEAPDGSARMISDFNASKQAGTILAPAEAARADGSGGVKFGQQVKLANGADGTFPLGAKIGAIYLASAGKYFGYVPTPNGVAVVDLTNTNGQTAKSAALSPVSIFSWAPSSPAKVAAFKVAFGSSDLYLLAGSIDGAVRIATINPTTGIPTDSASIAASGTPKSLAVAAVNGRIFVFSAEGTAGLHVYEYQPSQFSGTLTALPTSIPGNFDRLMVRGAQFPAILADSILGAGQSAIQIYDTKWLTQGGSPRLAYSLPQTGSGLLYFDNSFEAIVKTNGGAVTAYVYRLKSPGVTGAPALVTTDPVDISCISADLTAPPVAGASMTNLSAALRTGTETQKNYFGDRWRVKDSSSTGVALDQIEWDWNVASTYLADASLSGPLPDASLTDFNPAYFPCDPSGTIAGDPRSGASCYGSVGSPLSSADYRVGTRSHNSNGWAASPYISAPVTVLTPSADIVGLDRSVNPFNLRVLRGGSADAGASQGNLADASFFWTFSTPTGPLTGADITTTNPVVSIPTAATGFRMRVTYRGGYVAPGIAGNLSQVDLVPAFTATPNPVVKNAVITLSNTMQIAPAASLASVDWAITSSSTPPATFSGQLATSFLSVNGTDGSQAAPASPGTYYVYLRYNYSVSGINQAPIVVSRAITVIDQILLSLSANPTSANVGVSIAFTATGGNSSSVYGWNFGDNPFATQLTAGSATNSHSYSSAGQFSAIVCVTNVSPRPCAIASVTITGTTPPPPPPPPPPPGTLNASLSCPSQGTAGTALTCTASATGGSSYSYTWNWGDNVLGGTSSGPATNSHTYSAPGVFTVTVKVTSGTASDSATANVNIVRGGPPAPAAGYTLTGATQNQFNGNWEVEAGRTITLTATEPDAAATFSWTPSGSTSPAGPFNGRTVQFAFTSSGSRSVNLTVTGGGTATTGVTSTVIRITVTPPSFQALMIPGAGHIDPVPPATDGTWATDISVTNPGTQPMTLTLDYEPFGTTFPTDLSQIQFNSVNSVPLAAGQSWSATDVVKTRLSKDGRGVLILKYDGGNADPIATATVYYTQQGRSFGSSLPSFKVGPYGTTTQSLEVATEQTLVGLRNDAEYRFNLSLFNVSGQSGFFRVTAFGEDGAQVSILDESGAQTLSRDFPIGPFQQSLVQAADLGLTDSTKRYILKASPVGTGGTLIAAASALDRRNNDLCQVSDDTPRISAAADTLLDYFIPGVGRIVTDEAHWKTDLTLYSNSSVSRDLTFEYRFTDRTGVEQRVLAPVTIGPGRSVILDDVVGSVLAQYAPSGIDLNQQSTLGLLRISYLAASDSSTAPLLIGGRIYDDRGTEGTAGMQLFVYSNGESVAPGSPLVLPGAQQNLRFRTNIGFFAMGDLLTRVRVTAVKQDGSVAGVFDFVLNDSTRSGHYVQLPMSDIPGIVGDPMTIRIEVLEGSRVGAYVVTVDQISSDTVFVQGRPTHLLN